MLSREGKQTDRGAVGAEFIGYNRRRREALLLQEFPHQPNCRPSVPAGLNQEIQDFALTVHGTPEIELPPSNYDDHLVQVPAFGRSWPPTLNPPRIGPTEFQDPSSNCLIRDVETTLGKQVLNVPIAQHETAIEPDGMLDDDRWKAVTTVGYLAHPETLKHRPCRSHAVNVTIPSLGLDQAAVEEEERRRERERQRKVIEERSIEFAGTKLDTGDPFFAEAFRQLAENSIASDNGWFERSRRPRLTEFAEPEDGVRPSGGRAGGGAGRRKQAPEDQRQAMGLAGEWLAFQFLRRRHREAFDETRWVSRNRARFFGGDEGNDHA